MKIKIRWEKGELAAKLNDTPTSRALLKALPCRSEASRWGDEVYFEVPVNSSLEPEAVDVVDPGAVCFWVEGSSVALPFGPTPISKAKECRLVTKVNVMGKIEGDSRQLNSIREGDRIHLESAQR